MDSLKAFFLREVYKETQRLGDRLARVDTLIDWEAFRPIVQGLYDNRSLRGGRPNIDEVVMVKLLVLQEWYGLSDPMLERQVRRTFDALPDMSRHRPLASMECSIQRNAGLIFTCVRP